MPGETHSSERCLLYHNVVLDKLLFFFCVKYDFKLKDYKIV